MSIFGAIGKFLGTKSPAAPVVAPKPAAPQSKPPLPADPSASVKVRLGSVAGQQPDDLTAAVLLAVEVGKVTITSLGAPLPDLLQILGASTAQVGRSIVVNPPATASTPSA